MARNRSHSFTHFSIGDSRETGDAHKRNNKRPHPVWKTKLEGERKRKGNVSCDAMQTHPTTTQPKRLRTLLTDEKTISGPRQEKRSMVWQTTNLNRYGKTDNTMV